MNLTDAYWGDAFASEHGSWNRDRRTPLQGKRLPHRLCHPRRQHLGRPVGVTVANDGTLWRVVYTGK